MLNQRALEDPKISAGYAKFREKLGTDKKKKPKPVPKIEYFKLLGGEKVGTLARELMSSAAAVGTYYLVSSEAGTKMYSGFFGGFYDEQKKITTKGIAIQAIIAIVIHLAIKYFILDQV